MFWTSHSRCSQPWWFPKAFAFYHPLNLLVRELGFSLKSEQREAFWFLSNLRKYHSAVSNLCSTPQANSWGERCSFVQDNEKFVFQKAGQLWWCFTFSSRGKNHIFGAYSPTLNISKLCCETTAAIISLALSAFPLFEEQHRLFRYTATHFWSSRKHRIAHGNDAKDLLWNYWIPCSPLDTKPSADNSMHYSPAISMNEGI